MGDVITGVGLRFLDEVNWPWAPTARGKFGFFSRPVVLKG